MHSVTSLRLWAVIAAIIACAEKVTSAERAISIALEHAPLLVGETPVVRIDLRAGDNGDVVIKPERAMITEALSFELRRLGGDRVPGGLPHDATTKALPSDYVSILEGASSVYVKQVMATCRDSGDYVVKVRFAPFIDKSDAVERDLNVKCREITPDMIVDSFLVRKRGELGRPFENAAWELLNVRLHDSHVLVFRTMDAVQGVRMLARLLPCDANTRIAALLRVEPGADPIWSETWFTCNVENSLVFGRVNSVTGTLLEKRHLGLKQANPQ